MCHDGPVKKAIVNSPIRMKGNTKRTSGSSLSQTLLTEVELRLRCRLSRRVEIFENIVLLYLSVWMN